MTISLAQVEHVLHERFHGRLTVGRHRKDGQACALELLSVVQGIPWTDSPGETRTFDLRPLNDIKVPDDVRTQAMLPVIVAYAGSLDWPLATQEKVVERLVLQTVNQLIADFPPLPRHIRLPGLLPGLLGLLSGVPRSKKSSRNPVPFEWR